MHLFPAGKVAWNWSMPEALTSNSPGFAPGKLTQTDDNLLKPHFIGENFGGGIVFHFYDNGQHDLIAAPYDLTTFFRLPASDSRLS